MKKTTGKIGIVLNSWPIQNHARVKDGKDN